MERVKSGGVSHVTGSPVPPYARARVTPIIRTRVTCDTPAALRLPIS
jgi:hypothetical protein